MRSRFVAWRIRFAWWRRHTAYRLRQYRPVTRRTMLAEVYDLSDEIAELRRELWCLEDDVRDLDADLADPFTMAGALSPVTRDR